MYNIRPFWMTACAAFGVDGKRGVLNSLVKKMVEASGSELEALSGRLSPLPKSRAKPRDLYWENGRGEWI